MAAIDARSPSTRFKTDVPASETLSLRDLAGVLGVSYTVIQQLAQNGELPVPVVRIGRQYRIPRAAVNRLLGVESDAAGSGRAA